MVIEEPTDRFGKSFIFVNVSTAKAVPSVSQVHSKLCTINNRCFHLPPPHSEEKELFRVSDSIGSCPASLIVVEACPQHSCDCDLCWVFSFTVQPARAVAFGVVEETATDGKSVISSQSGGFHD